LSHAKALVEKLCTDSAVQHWHGFLTSDEPSNITNKLACGCEYTLPTTLERAL